MRSSGFDFLFVCRWKAAVLLALVWIYFDQELFCPLRRTFCKVIRIRAVFILVDLFIALKIFAVYQDAFCSRFFLEPYSDLYLACVIFFCPRSVPESISANYIPISGMMDFMPFYIDAFNCDFFDLRFFCLACLEWRSISYRTEYYFRITCWCWKGFSVTDPRFIFFIRSKTFENEPMYTVLSTS